MQNNILKKIDLFLRRHLIFASFIFLSLLIHVLTLPIHIESLLEQAKKSFFILVVSLFPITILNSIPIFLFSLFLYIFIDFDFSSEPPLTARQVFLISLFSSLILTSTLFIIFFSYLGGFNIRPIQTMLSIIASSSIYSLLFAAFISWYGNVPHYISFFKYKYF